MFRHSRPWLRTLVFIGVADLLCTCAGCGNAPVSYRTRFDTPWRVSTLRAVAIAPLEIEVEEVGADGATRNNDELTALVERNITMAIGAHPELANVAIGEKLTATPDREELGAMMALFRALRQDDPRLYDLAAQPYRLARPPLRYKTRRIDRLADALRADGVLFIYVRHQCRSAKLDVRAPLELLGSIAAGGYARLRSSRIESSAALVERDGTLLWFNRIESDGTNLRRQTSAAAWLNGLLAGLPSLPKSSPPIETDAPPLPRKNEGNASPAPPLATR